MGSEGVQLGLFVPTHIDELVEGLLELIDCVLFFEFECFVFPLPLLFFFSQPTSPCIFLFSKLASVVILLFSKFSL